MARRLRPGKRTAAGAILLGLALALPGPSFAQFVAYGGVEADSRDQSLLLIGAVLQPVDPGWRPYGGVMAYRLNYLSSAGTVTIDALAPSAGVRKASPSGLLQVGLGYLFLASEATAALGGPSGSSEGFLLSALVEQYRGPRVGQLAGSFNVGDSYFWARGRGAQRLGIDPGAGPLAVGAEAVFQGGGQGDGYHSFQIGPTVEIPLSRTFRLLTVAGWKSDDLPQTRGGGFPYAKLEFSYVAN